MEQPALNRAISALSSCWDDLEALLSAPDPIASAAADFLQQIPVAHRVETASALLVRIRVVVGAGGAELRLSHLLHLASEVLISGRSDSAELAVGLGELSLTLSKRLSSSTTTFATLSSSILKVLASLEVISALKEPVEVAKLVYGFLSMPALPSIPMVPHRQALEACFQILLQLQHRNPSLLTSLVDTSVQGSSVLLELVLKHGDREVREISSDGFASFLVHLIPSKRITLRQQLVGFLPEALKAIDQSGAYLALLHRLVDLRDRSDSLDEEDRLLWSQLFSAVSSLASVPALPSDKALTSLFLMLSTLVFSYRPSSKSQRALVELLLFESLFTLRSTALAARTPASRKAAFVLLVELLKRSHLFVFS